VDDTIYEVERAIAIGDPEVWPELAFWKEMGENGQVGEGYCRWGDERK
jgi:hypothetical protein